MRWTEVRTVEHLRQLEPSLVEALTGKSKDFFIPASPNVHWEVERKPYYTDVLILRPNQDVSRAWDFVFRVVLSRIAPLGSEQAPYHIPPQAEPPFTGPPMLYIELPDKDRAASKRAAEAINAATAVAKRVSEGARCAGDVPRLRARYADELRAELIPMR
jgi:hypothetical protein